MKIDFIKIFGVVGILLSLLQFIVPEPLFKIQKKIRARIAISIIIPSLILFLGYSILLALVVLIALVLVFILYFLWESKHTIIHRIHKKFPGSKIVRRLYLASLISRKQNLTDKD